MSKLREAAAGMDCQCRFPNVCNYNPETTVLAHIRRGGVSGVGQKPLDLVGVWACSNCHDAIDKRDSMGSYTPDELDGMILDALCRTLDQVTQRNLAQYAKPRRRR